MAVYARGYRAYEGTFGSRTPTLAIFRQGLRSVLRSRSFKVLGMITLILFVVFLIQLYIQLNIEEFANRAMGGGRGGQDFDIGHKTARFLHGSLMGFYGMVATIGALISLLGGSGLIADDLRTRALPLYLVRPIRPIDYVIGKALVLPALLAIVVLLPGCVFYLFAGLWQPKGTTGTWMWEHLDILGTVVHSYLCAALGFTGLMLLLSSRSSRRGGVMGVAAAVYFGGAMLAGLGAGLSGGAREMLKHLSLIWNSVSPFIIAHAEFRQDRLDGTDRLNWIRDHNPSPTAALMIAAILCGVGCVAVYRRARTTEVSE